MTPPKWTPGQVHQVDVSWLNLFEAFGATGAFFFRWAYRRFVGRYGDMCLSCYFVLGYIGYIILITHIYIYIHTYLCNCIYIWYIYIYMIYIYDIYISVCACLCHWTEDRARKMTAFGVPVGLGLGQAMASAAVCSVATTPFWKCHRS